MASNKERVDEEVDKFWETLPLETQSRLANAFRANHEHIPNLTLGHTPHVSSRSVPAPPRRLFYNPQAPASADPGYSPVPTHRSRIARDAAVPSEHSSELPPTHTAPSPSVAPQSQTIILPDFSGIGSFSNRPNESWDNFIDQWEVQMRPYNFSSQQLALSLPKSLKDTAYTKYKKLIKATPLVVNDYSLLRPGLDRIFNAHVNIQGRGLYTMQQGKRSVGEFYTELSAVADTAYSHIPELYRDDFLVDIFIQGLRESIRKVVSSKGRMTLSQAVYEAEKEELNDLHGRSSSKIHSIDADLSGPHEVAGIRDNLEAYIEPLKKQIGALKKLVTGQARKSQGDIPQANGVQDTQQHNNQRSSNQYNQTGSNRNQNTNPNRNINQNMSRGMHHNANQNRNVNRQNQYGNQNQYSNQNQYANQNQYGNHNQYGNNQYGNQNQYNPNAYSGNFNNANQTRPFFRSSRGRGGRGASQAGRSDICYCCGQSGHWANRCPHRQQAAANAISNDDLSPDQFASMMLTDNLPGQINSVETSNPGRSGGRKLSLSDTFTLSLLMFLCLIGSTTAQPELSQVFPGEPMICGSASANHPTIYNLSHVVPCSIRPNQTHHPQKVKLQVYQQNVVQYKSKAWQCSKYTTTVTTQISFFGDIKTRHETTTTKSVSREECETMIKLQSCTDGKLAGGNGIYLTQNTVDASYRWCCVKHDFSVNQCSVVSAYVYKRHSENTFESTAGSVSHCSYESGSCLLKDDSMLIWDVNPETFCAYEPWFNVSGQYLDFSFVSDDKDFAITFHEHGFNTTKDCSKDVTSLSDQGVMVKFMTHVNLTLSKDHIEDNYVLTAGGDSARFVAILNVALQSILVDMVEAQRNLFWTNYLYTCNNIKHTLKLVAMLMEQHPTMSARYLLQNPYIRATAGPGVFQVYPCTAIHSSFYSMLPMQKDNCTNFLPINVSMAGSYHVGYLDPITNIIHRDTFTVQCSSRESTIVRLNNQTLVYHHDGTLKEIDHMKNLSLPDIHLGAHPIKLQPPVFNQKHLLNWQNYNNHESLNDILSTLSRQKQVLEAVGVLSTRHRSIEDNAVESKESILGNSLFAFLFGGHVASGYELWSFTCNILVSIFLLTLICKKLIQRCCPNYSISLPALRNKGMVANIEAQTESDSDAEVSETDDIKTNVNDAIEPKEIDKTMNKRTQTELYLATIEDKAMVDQDDINETTRLYPTNLNEITVVPKCKCTNPTVVIPSAPTETSTIAPYRSIYPDLPSASSVHEIEPSSSYGDRIAWPSFYRPSY